MEPLCISASFDEIPVDSHRRLPFQPPYRVRHAEFRWDAQTHVDMVGHRVPFHQLHSKLPTEIFQYSSDLFSQHSVYCLLTILRYDDDVVSAIPSYMELALPLSYLGFSSRTLAGSEENLPSVSASRPPERQSLFGSHRQSRRLTSWSYRFEFGQPDFGGRWFAGGLRKGLA
jgi:hypothetical protein